MNKFIHLAAAAVLVIVALPFLLNNSTSPAIAEEVGNLVMCPEGGRLDAVDAQGLSLGPCVLKHTDVHALVQGHFTRVTVKQKYHNPHRDKIEAVYTFPLSHRGAVDRMNMTVGDRVIVGQVKEREAAKQMYESARDAGRVASLLEQERPNIFTQSIANIDPGADIDIEISYVETIDNKDGVYSLVFPTVVSPRYIPGDMPRWIEAPEHRRADAADAPPMLPAGTQYRRGLVLSAPAKISLAGRRTGEGGSDATIQPATIDAAVFNESLIDAVPIQIAAAEDTSSAPLAFEFEAKYPDGSVERGAVRPDFTGEIGGRWFYLPQRERAWRVVAAGQAPAAGEPFARPTGQVPDANRITPTPVRPPLRSGHDISVTVEVDTGGAGLTEVDAPLHATTRQDLARRPDGLASKARITLTNQSEIPNRDFVLNWKQTRDAISEGVFTTSARQGDFFAVILNPPARVADEQAVPRELIFVLDTSGSMNGPPIEKSKAVAARMIESMRARDTFNVITFAGRTSVLWDRPRPSTEQNRREALDFFKNKGGAGGTEMMAAINAALEQRIDGRPTPITLEDLANMPADGRIVTIGCLNNAIERVPASGTGAAELRLRVRGDLTVRASSIDWHGGNADAPLTIVGEWTTVAGDRVLRVQSIAVNADPPANPLRIVVFLTDGEVGNEGAIIEAVKRNRGTTRVFSYGIGNSVNRYLLSEAAMQGGGEAEFILIPRGGDGEAMAAVDRQADDAARRLHEKTRTPVLANISVEFSPNLSVADMEPAPGTIPDLYDVQPLVILGRFNQPGDGTVTVRGTTGAGRWERTMRLSLQNRPQNADERLAAVGGDGVVATLWARARIDALMNSDLRALLHGNPPESVRRRIVQIGENFGIMSRFTSFVAVDYQRVTIEGRPRLVRVPIELPDQTAWENYFCSEVLLQPVERLSTLVDELDRSQRERAGGVAPDMAGLPVPPQPNVAPAVVGGSFTPSHSNPPTAKPAAAPAPEPVGRRFAPEASVSAPPPAPSGSGGGGGAPVANVPADVKKDVFPSKGVDPQRAARGEEGRRGAMSAPDSAAPGFRAARPTANGRFDDPKPMSELSKGKNEAAVPAMLERKLSFARQPDGFTSDRETAVLQARMRANPAADKVSAIGLRTTESEGLSFGDDSDGTTQTAAAGAHDGGQVTAQDLTAFVLQDLPEEQSRAAVAEESQAARMDELRSQLGTRAGWSVDSTPRRLVPLTAAKLIAAAVRVGSQERARFIRDRFQPQFPGSELLKEAAGLIAQPEASASTGTADAPTDEARADKGSPTIELDRAIIDALVKRIDEAAARETLVAKRLDPRLYSLLPGTTARATERSGAPEPLIIAILVKQADEQTMEALRRAGFVHRSTIKDQACLVGIAKPADLTAIALVEGVRRVELVEE
ncbi:MAG: VWA domain-containing protein [Phycisphaerales bacterium]|nr:VWA domain-containing protein [Phycisphaerales bacterium]